MKTPLQTAYELVITDMASRCNYGPTDTEMINTLDMLEARYTQLRTQNHRATKIQPSSTPGASEEKL